MRPIFTQLLGSSSSNVSRHMKTAYPDTLELRRLVRAAAGDIVVEPGDAHAGTVGTAFDLLTGFLLIPDHVPLDPPASPVWRPVHALIADSFTEFLHDAIPARKDMDEVYQAVWVLAELTNMVRAGYSNPEGKLATVIREGSGMKALLGITPPDGIRQLRELEAVATEHLYPHVHDAQSQVSFPGVSAIVQAEADLLDDTLLMDLKTNAGAPHKTTGARAYFPTATDIHQLLGYALMDTPDGHGIEAVGLYAARYGLSSIWEVPQLLGITAGGHAVNIDAARASFRFALEADYEAANAR